MEITVTEQNTAMILILNGSLDATTADQVARRISGELSHASEESRRPTNIVLDLSGVDFMSSAGLRAILAAVQDVRNAGGDLRLAGGDKNIKRVLDFSGFTKIMKYYDTVAEAVESFTV
jgi:anti-sigma B factor antagonist